MLCACSALLTEAAGDHEQAATLQVQAAERWQRFGNVPERAYALLGQGRCFCALGQAAEAPLREARKLFRAMGYKPALADSEALLEQAAGAPATPRDLTGAPRETGD